MSVSVSPEISSIELRETGKGSSNDIDNLIPSKPKTTPKERIILVCIIGGLGILLCVMLGLMPLYLPKSSNSDVSTSANETTTTTTTTSTTTASTTTSTTTTTQSTTSTTSTTTTSTTTTTTTSTTTQAPTCIVNPNPVSIAPYLYNSNSCPNNQVYTPNWLTYDSMYLFNYPILQVMMCKDNKIEIKCPTGQLINFYSIYFGVQPDTNDYYCGTPNPSTQPVLCLNTKSFTNLQSICQGKNVCRFQSVDTTLSSSCYGFTNAQLLVQYQCVDSSKLSTVASCSKNTTIDSICPDRSDLGSLNIYEAQYCYSTSPVSVSCSTGYVIDILCAFYGIDQSINTCDNILDFDFVRCYSTEAYTTIYNSCQGKNSCSFSSVSASFTNVCGSLSTLYIQWTCVQSSYLSTTSTTTAATTTSLPYCANGLVTGTCKDTSSFSPYVPKSLTNSTQLYFDYPIYQQTVCQNSRILIHCPSDLVIHIYAAYFGIQSYTTTTWCTPVNSSYENPAMCYFQNAFDTINSTCEYQTSCYVYATVNAMSGGDICPDYTKQLTVQYQCVDSRVLSSYINACPVNTVAPSICSSTYSGLSTTLNQQTWCDNENSMSITCDTGKKITILCAFYGVHPALESCNIEYLTYKPVCYFSSSQTTVNSTCNGLNSCSLSNFTSTFKDPCIGIDKALFVQWTCV